jgi:hypothetical protein
MKNLEVGKTYRLRKEVAEEFEPTEYICEYEIDAFGCWHMSDNGIWVKPEDFKIKVLQVAKCDGPNLIVEGWDSNYSVITRVSVSMFEYYEEVEELKKDEYKGQIWSEYNQRWIWC